MNIAARVQALATSSSIFATRSVVDHPATARVLGESGCKPVAQQFALRGIADEVAVYEIPWDRPAAGETTRA